MCGFDIRRMECPVEDCRQAFTNDRERCQHVADSHGSIRYDRATGTWKAVEGTVRRGQPLWMGEGPEDFPPVYPQSPTPRPAEATASASVQTRVSPGGSRGSMLEILKKHRHEYSREELVQAWIRKDAAEGLCNPFILPRKFEDRLSRMEAAMDVYDMMVSEGMSSSVSSGGPTTTAGTGDQAVGSSQRDAARHPYRP